MKIKPSKADEQGVRWCSEECEQRHPFAKSVLIGQCGVSGSYVTKITICEPWARELVKANESLLAAMEGSYLPDVVREMQRIRSLLHDDEIEVE